MKRSMGNGSVESSYPFACAAINVVFMLTDLMKLQRSGDGEVCLCLALHECVCVCMCMMKGHRYEDMRRP